jgi:hypothetical protein
MVRSHLFQALARSSQIIVTDANMVGEDAKSDEVCADASFVELAFDGMDADAKGGEVRFCCNSSVGQLGFVIGKEGEVIDVSQVGGNAKPIDYKVIQPV